MRKKLVYFVTFAALFLLSIKIVEADEGVVYLYEVTGPNIERYIETFKEYKKDGVKYAENCNPYDGCMYSQETTESIVTMPQSTSSVNKTEIMIDKRGFAKNDLYPDVIGKMHESLVYINKVPRGTFRVMYLKRDKFGYDWYSAEMVFGETYVMKSIEKRKGDVGIEEVFINQHGNITYKKLIKDPGI